MENEMKSFSYVPHYRTLTKSGQSHFSRVSDAIAEFIDNSLQATQKNRQNRNIHIYLDLNFYSGSSYMAICDNGKGMNEKEIRRFARYCDAKEYAIDDFQDPTNISLFGVGSKEAGFYLGERLHVITKSNDCDQAIELVLDEHEMEEKYQNGQDVSDYLLLSYCPQVYEGNYFLQPLSHRSSLWLNYHYPSKFEELRGTCEENQSFTLIILKLRNIIVRNLQRSDTYDKLPSTLADLYHFHLHPENLPTTTMKRMSSVATGRIDDEDLEQEIFPPPGWKDTFRENTTSFLRSTTIYQCPPTPLNLTLEISTNGGTPSKCDLKNFVDINSLLFEHASFCFRFTFQLPDPNFEERQNLSQAPSNIVARTPQKLWTQEHTGANHREFTIHGLILYFPFHDGKSTRPSVSITSFSQDGDLRECCDLVDDETAEVDKIIRVYWQNRLVPETQLSQMPFFPAAKTAFQCEKAKLPLEWRDRIRGFIFFDSNFINISNNKLKIKADPDFETWIHEKDIKKRIIYNPKNIDKDFERWLQLCHQTYDDELRFECRVSNDEKLRSANLLSKEKFFYLFSQLTHTIGQHQHLIKIGDNIKISLTKSKKGRKNSKDFIYVKVLGFLPSCEYLRIDQDTCGGTGHLWYQQIPSEVYGLTESLAPISSIDFQNYQATEEDIEDIRNKAACSIKTVVHRTDYREEDLAGESIKKGLVVDVGENIKYLAVRVLNKNREVLISPPGSTRKYRVKMTIPTMDKDFGTSQITYSRENRDRVVFMSSDRVKDAHQGFHLFMDLCFKESGTHIIKIEVLDGDMLALPPIEYQLIIKSGPVAGFVIEGDFSSPVALGGYLPPFSLLFRDESNQLAIPPRFSVTLSSPGMTFKYNGESLPEFEAHSSNQISFDHNQWLGLPVSDSFLSQSDPFISSTKVGSKKVKIAVKVSCCQAQMFFHLTYIPGCPRRLSFITPSDGHISVPNGEILETITLACLDGYGNRCSPTPQFGTKWYVRLDEKGPLSCDLEKFPVQTDGLVTLNGLYPELEESVAFPGVRIVQSLFLEWPTHLGINQESEIKEELCITVTPGTKPSSLEVVYGEDILSVCRLPVGTIMSGLKLQIMTENNTPWEPSSTTSLIVRADWNKLPAQNKKKSRGKKSAPPVDPVTSLCLPDIKLPTVITDTRLMFEVECTIDSKHSFLAQFFVELIPAEPVKWSIILNPTAKNGVQCLRGDLSSKVLGVWLVDEHGNDAPANFVPISPPSLLISWESNDSLPVDQTQHIPLTLQDTNSSMLSGGVFPRKYILDSDVSLICDRALPAPFWVWAFDPSGTYQSACETLTAVASSPTKFYLRCPSMFGEDSVPTNQLEPLPFTTTSQISDLEIYFVDNYDHEASFSNLQDIMLRITTNVTSDIVGVEIEPQEIIFYQKKNPKNKMTNISINFSKLTEVIERYRPLANEEMFEFAVSCSYVLNGEKYMTTPSLILCKFLLLNIVTKLFLSYRVLQPPLVDAGSSVDSFYDHTNLSMMSVENGIPCGRESKINLCLHTEDNQVVEIEPKDIDIHITYTSSSGAEATNELIDIEGLKATFYVEISNTTQTNISYLLPELTKTGKYTLLFTYTENRPKFTTNKFIPPSLLTCKASLNLNCVPGPARSLEPSTNSRHHLHDLCATTSMSSHESDRIVVESLEFKLKDEYGNDAPFPDNCVVRCKLSRLTYDNVLDKPIANDLPLFVNTLLPGQQDHGIEQLVSIPMTQYCQSFPKIQLQQSEKNFGGDGNIEMIFDLWSSLQHVVCGTVENFTLSFHFTTDEGRALKERQFREEISPYLQQYDQLTEELRKTEVEHNEIEHQMKDVIRRAYGLHLGEYLSTSQLTQSELLKYEQEKLQEKSDMLKANSHVRTSFKISTISIPEKLIDDGTVIGQVVDIGYVDPDPPRLAEIMSWAASSYMHALVVSSDSLRRDGYFRDQSIALWEVDRIVPFHNSKGKIRTQNEISKRLIPLDLPRINETVTGNPRFMVNQIHLQPLHERLRDTIFYQIFQNSIIIDTEKDAIAYRALLVENRICPLPTIYTLDGVRLRADGLQQLSDRFPGKLDYIFGERSVTDLIDFRNLDRELGIIAEMKEFLKQENELSTARRRLESERNEIRCDIERIESKYGMVKSKKIRKASEIYDEEISASQFSKKKKTRK